MIVIARRYGQLGNRLFLYAHMIAAARHYGVELRNPCFAEYASWFPNTEGDLWCRYPADGRREPADHSYVHSDRVRDALMGAMQIGAKSLYVSGLRRFPVRVIRLQSGEQCDLLGDRFRDAVKSGRPVLCQGWMFRSRELFDAHQDGIREFFTPSEADQASIDATIQAARQNCDVLVGVHIRRGDYATFKNGRYFFEDAEYSKWMRSISHQFSGRKVGFLVCTNEPIDHSKFKDFSITMGPGSAIGDMYALAETDIMMGPPSTFTGWASFYGSKPLIHLTSKNDEMRLPDSFGRHPMLSPLSHNQSSGHYAAV